MFTYTIPTPATRPAMPVFPFDAKGFEDTQTINARDIAPTITPVGDEQKDSCRILEQRRRRRTRLANRY